MSSNLDYYSRGITRAFAKRQTEQTKQLAEQQEMQSAQENIQQQLLTMADLKAQIAITQNADNAIANNTSINVTTKLSDDDELYKQTLVTNMVALIKQRNMK